MPALSFRFKLLLAMMLVVAGVSVTTLLVTERRVQAYYDRTFETQFERQIAYFLALQETRLGNVKEECLKLSQTAPVVAALKQDKVDPDALYLGVSNELRLVLVSAFQESKLAVIPGPRRGLAAFFRFLDVQGRPIDPPESARKQFPSLGLAKRLVEQKVARVRGALDSPERQQIGYLSVTQLVNQPILARKGKQPPAAAEKPGDINGPALQEVIITKILDPASEAPLGAMVVGFALADLIPQPKADSPTNRPAQPEAIQSGILFEERLYANPTVIPETMAAAVAQQLSQRIQATKKVRDDFDCEIQSTPYRVFYELLNQSSAFPPAYQACLYSLEEARREQKDLRWKILASAGVALLCALLLSLFLSHGLSVPIRELVKATGEIREGNFDVKVPVRSRDEIGQLATSFNEMAEGLIQKERYRTVLNLVADEKVAEHLMSKGIALGGEVREVSILFCDIRNFTALTQNMPPEEVIEMLNEHMTALTRVVKEHNGVLDKFVGDLLMAVFGAPMSHGNDALDAAQSAMELLRRREEVNQTSRYKLSIGIGLASGPVVAGCMGSTDHLNYTVIGERVNLASRLCDHARPGEVLIDQTTVERLGNLAVAEPTAVLELKGFAARVQAYRLREVLQVAVPA